MVKMVVIGYLLPRVYVPLRKKDNLQSAEASQHSGPDQAMSDKSKKPSAATSRHNGIY